MGDGRIKAVERRPLHDPDALARVKQRGLVALELCRQVLQGLCVRRAQAVASGAALDSMEELDRTLPGFVCLLRVIALDVGDERVGVEFTGELPVELHEPTDALLEPVAGHLPWTGFRSRGLDLKAVEPPVRSLPKQVLMVFAPDGYIVQLACCGPAQQNHAVSVLIAETELGVVSRIIMIEAGGG